MEVLHACVRASLCEIFFCLFNEERRGDEKRREEKRREEVDIPIPPFRSTPGLDLLRMLLFSTLLYFRLIATLHSHLFYSTLPYIAFASVWMSYAYAGKSRVGSVRLMR